MSKITQDEQYSVEIYTMFIDAFSSENEDQKWEITDIDATAWFTGLIKASGLLYNNLTKDDKTYFEFTHLLQNLLVQNMMEKKEAA